MAPTIIRLALYVVLIHLALLTLATIVRISIKIVDDAAWVEPAEAILDGVVLIAGICVLVALKCYYASLCLPYITLMVLNALRDGFAFISMLIRWMNDKHRNDVMEWNHNFIQPQRLINQSGSIPLLWICRVFVIYVVAKAYFYILGQTRQTPPSAPSFTVPSLRHYHASSGAGTPLPQGNCVAVVKPGGNHLAIFEEISLGPSICQRPAIHPCDGFHYSHHERQCCPRCDGLHH